MTNNITIFRALAALVRGFFDAFAEGVLVGVSRQDEDKHTISPKLIKQMMLEHYGKIGNSFFDTMFYIIARLDNDVDSVRKRLEECFSGGSPTVPQLMRLACGSDELYNAMVEEYKRNFGLLLCGRVARLNEHVESYSRTNPACKIEERLAVLLLVRTLVKAYVAGINVSGCGMTSFSQAVLLRLMIENINILVNEAPLDVTSTTIDDLLLKACGSEINMNVALNEMTSLCSELVSERKEETEN